ncbi:MAG: alpha/beta fold hydrolase [Dehalococcoidia bacterium]
MESRFISAGAGLSLHVVDYGGDGPPLLLVHGTGLIAQVWGVMVPYLTPHFRVFALDRKGHGESDKPEHGYQLEESAAEYAAVIEQLGGDGWAAIGHSSGGTSLGLTAARHPALFRGVAMVDPIIFPSRRRASTALDGARSMAERTRQRRGQWPNRQLMFDDLATKRAFRTWQPQALWDYVHYGAEIGEDGAVRLKCPPEIESRMYAHASDLDLFDEFARIAAPTLIIRGGQTDRFPRESAERAVASNPNIRLIEMPDLSHFASMENPAEVSRLCVDFLTAPEMGLNRRS